VIEFSIVRRVRFGAGLVRKQAIVVVFLGFLLIHLSSHGMDYGFILGAVLNTLSLFLLGRKLAKAKESQERVN
jgi:O-antigen/teichoic acid export membrane protein